MSEQKSPRDWLLRRHASRTADLDAGRRAILAAQLSPSTTAVTASPSLLGAIFGPHRALWQGFAAVWLLLLLFHLTLGRPPQSPSGPPPAPESVIAWFRQFNAHETLAQVHR